MYQDGYVVRREFLQKVKDAIFDIDIEGELNDFIFNRKCYGPSDYSLLPLLFLKLVALRKINHVHLERNIRFIVDKADIYFNLVQPQYHKEFVNQLSLLLLFLMQSDKLAIILSQNQLIQEILNFKLLNNYIIIYFAYIVFKEFESVYSQGKYLKYFRAKNLSIISNQLYILNNHIEQIEYLIYKDLKKLGCGLMVTKRVFQLSEKDRIELINLNHSIQSYEQFIAFITKQFYSDTCVIEHSVLKDWLINYSEQLIAWIEQRNRLWESINAQFEYNILTIPKIKNISYSIDAEKGVIIYCYEN